MVIASITNINADKEAHGDRIIVECCSFHEFGVVEVNDEASVSFHAFDHPVDENILDTHVAVDDALLVRRSITWKGD